ncbi:MAG: endoribonuclease MazF [Candidatus Eremiobacteraeota bacterium]|nr:endoribonuclease MazF [Candidatus Eremiobacteraeota bacterium]
MVERRDFIPEKGDIVALVFSPKQGHEQAGKRPALVVSPSEYNRKTGLFLACPVTSKVKGYPFEVTLPDFMTTQGVVLADQVKSLDWKHRKAAFIEKAPEGVLGAVTGRIRLLIGE